MCRQVAVSPADAVRNVALCRGDLVPSVLAERLADRVDAIVGVDTHTDTHTAAVVSPLGSVLAELTVAATADGVAVLLAWARHHTDRLRCGPPARAPAPAPPP